MVFSLGILLMFVLLKTKLNTNCSSHLVLRIIYNIQVDFYFSVTKFSKVKNKFCSLQSTLVNRNKTKWIQLINNVLHHSKLKTVIIMCMYSNNINNNNNYNSNNTRPNMIKIYHQVQIKMCVHFILKMACKTQNATAKYIVITENKVQYITKFADVSEQCF